MRHLLMIPQGIMAVGIVVLSVLFSWLLVRLVRRFESYSDWKGDNEFVGFT